METERLLVPPVCGVRQRDPMVQVQEGYGSDGFGFEVELLGNDLLHALQVRHGEAALSDANEFVGWCEVALLLRDFGRHVEAAEADTRQVLGLDLRADGLLMIWVIHTHNK